MPAPYVGQVVNDYVYVGGDPNSQTSWRGASPGEIAADKARGTQVGKAAGIQFADRRNQFDAAQGMQEQANTAYKALAKTDTGPLAGIALGAARFGLPFSGGEKKAQNLGAIKRMGGEGALALADSMKGALSDKDIAFLKSMTYDLGSTTGENKDVARVQEWASQKARSYLLSRARWERELGSIENRNPTGQNFDDKWAEYSARVYPRPEIGVSGRYQPNIPRSAPQSSTPTAGRGSPPRLSSAAPKAGTRLRYNPQTGDFE